MSQLIRGTRILGRIVSRSLAEFLMYRFAAITTIIFTTIFAVAEVVAILVYYRFTDDIAGWDLPAFLALIATFHAIQNVYQFLFVVGHEELADRIVEGDLDYDLIRPVNSLLLCSLRSLDFASIINLILPTVILVNVWPKIGAPITIPTIALYLVTVAIGVLFYYSLNQVLVALGFWIERSEKLSGLGEYIFEFASRPRQVYPKALRFTLTVLIPVVTAVNVPVEILTLQISWVHVIHLLVPTAVLWVVARLQWTIGIKRYASAN